jgi:mono/diheme cytochrome c family protein/DNA-binding beta-propeller fold protein YncE
VTRYLPCKFCLAAILACVISVTALPASAGSPQHYYTEFDSDLHPWQAAEEKNFEEVFKNYEFFAIAYTNGGADLEVSHYIKGAVADVSHWQLQPDGTLLALDNTRQGAGGEGPDAGRLYLQHCANCHGADRLGIAGPALLPENLGRLAKAEAIEVIRDGRPATQMPPFGKQLDAADIDALADFIFTPPAVTPVWDSESIRASHVLLHAPGTLPDKPRFTADPLNLFMVVEAGDHHVTVLDGDSLEPIYRFASRYALHGGLKYSPDGRYVYLASRDGWISKFDIYNLTLVAEIRVGINTRNVAVSGDGRTVLAGNYLPETLVLLDASDLSLLRVIPVADSEGKASRVSAVYQAEPRASFVAALKDVPEVWEISYDKPDYPVRRIRLQRVLDDFFFNQDYTLLIGADRAQNGGQVIDLESGRKVAELPLDGMPHLGSGIIWEYQGHPVMATPNLKQGLVTVIDMDSWKVVRQLETLGPGFFMRSHENTPYAWTDVFFGPNKDVMHVFDKRTLEMVKTIRPEPGKTSGHVEFTRDGRYALVSLWEMDGALIVYDAATLTEVKRIPMCKPSGKYNVYNKVTRSAGTSH